MMRQTLAQWKKEKTPLFTAVQVFINLYHSWNKIFDQQRLQSDNFLIHIILTDPSHRDLYSSCQGQKPPYEKLPIFSEFMENSAKFIKNSNLTKWTQNLRQEDQNRLQGLGVHCLKIKIKKLHIKSMNFFQYFHGLEITFGKYTVNTS